MELKECGKKIDSSSFSEVENLILGQLPEDYKAFMLEHNGGRPLKRYVLSFTEHDPETDKDFESGLDIYSFNKIEDIPLFYNNLYGSELIPEHYCPIADDSCGNEILLCTIKDSNYGNIFFADNEMFEADESFVITKLADSFEEFINLLREE